MSDTVTTTAPSSIPALPLITYPKPLPLSAKVKEIEWQLQAANDIVDKLRTESGCLLRGGTGIGKMYIKAYACRIALERGLLKPIPGSFNPMPILWLTPKSVKRQTMDVLKDMGIIHCVMVLSYGELKSKAGNAMFLGYRTDIKGGQPEIIPDWYPHMLMPLMVCDEVQCVRNSDSMQTKTVYHAPDSVKWLGASATPGQRPQDFKTIAVRCGATTRSGANSWLRTHSSPKRPDEYSPSATKRIRQALDKWIVEPKNIRFKFPSQTKQITIHFQTAEERQRYELAYQEYLRKLREIKGIIKSHTGIRAKWVADQKFQQEAELIRTPHIADRAIAKVNEGKQVLVGSNFLDTLRGVWVNLVKVRGFDRNRIGFIIGGQTDNERERQREMFNSGQYDIILIMMKAAGVGISLHHDRIESRPRHCIIPPTWSAIDFVQLLGRAHRLTSISATTQEVLWYGDTVEDRVRDKVAIKCKCISASVTAKEQFASYFEKAAGLDLDEDDDDYAAYGEEVRAAERGNDDDSEISSYDDGITGEGLDSVDDSEMPTTYR